MSKDDALISKGVLEGQKLTPIELENIKKESLEALINLIRIEHTGNLKIRKNNELKKLTDGQGEVTFASNLRRILTLSAKADGSFEVTPELEKLLNKALNSEEHNLLNILYGIGMRFDLEFSADAFSNMLQGVADELEEMKTRESDLQLKIDALNSNDAQPIVEEKLNGLREELEKLQERQKELSGLREKLHEIGITSSQPPTQEQLEMLKQLLNDENSEPLRHAAKENYLIKSKRNYSKAERENMIESIRLFVDQKHSLNDMSIQTLIRLESEMDQTYQYLMSINKTLSDTIKLLARNSRG